MALQMKSLILVAATALMIGVPVVRAEQPIIPPAQLPEPLRPYADEAQVIAAATEVMSLLRTAKVVLHPATDRPISCNKPETLSIYRGMVVSLVAYKLFVNRVELGWLSTQRMMSADGRKLNRALLRPRRLSLWTVWRSGDIAKIIVLANQFTKLPSLLKNDLSSFLLLLQKAGAMYSNLRERAPNKLAAIERISAPLYSLKKQNSRSRLFNATPKDLQDFDKKWPDDLIYHSVSAAYRELVNSVRDIGHDKLSDCLDGDRKPHKDKPGNKQYFVSRVEFGSKGEIVDETYGHYPIAYSIGFWRRRHHDATTALAEFVIARALAALETN